MELVQHEDRLAQLIAEKNQTFKHFAHYSSVCDPSLLAEDSSGNCEIDLQRLLDEES